MIPKTSKKGRGGHVCVIEKGRRRRKGEVREQASQALIGNLVDCRLQTIRKKQLRDAAMRRLRSGRRESKAIANIGIFRAIYILFSFL